MRVLGPNERWHYISDQYAPLNVVVSCRVRGPLDAGSLRRALDELQARHGLLRTRIVERESGPTFLADVRGPAPLVYREEPSLAPARLRDEIERELNQPFDAESGPLWRALALRTSPRGAVDDEHIVALVASHTIADGPSLLRALEEVVALAGDDTPARAEEPGDLPPAVEIVLGDLTGLRGAQKFANTMRRTIVAGAVRRPVRLTPDTAVPFEGRRTRLIQKETEASTIRALCARTDLERKDLFAAALARAVADDVRARGTAGPVHVMIGSSFDFRPLNAALTGAVSTSVGQIPTKLEDVASRPVVELAEQFRAGRRAQTARSEPIAGLRLLTMVAPKSKSESGRMVKLLDKSGPGHVSVNDVRTEHFPSRLGPLRIAEPQVFVSLSISGFLLCTPSAHGTELRCNFTYIEGLLTPERAEQLAERTIAYVREAADASNTARTAA